MDGQVRAGTLVCAIPGNTKGDIVCRDKTDLE